MLIKHADGILEINGRVTTVWNYENSSIDDDNISVYWDCDCQTLTNE